MSYTVHKHCSFHCSYQQWNGGFALELYTKGLRFVLCSGSFTSTAQPDTNASFYFRFGLGYTRSVKRRYQPVSIKLSDIKVAGVGRRRREIQVFGSSFVELVNSLFSCVGVPVPFGCGRRGCPLT